MIGPEVFAQFFSTLCGAAAGAYCAYRLADRQMSRREKDDYLGLLLIVHEHLDGLKSYLELCEDMTDLDVSYKVSSRPFVVPSISDAQIQRLMEVAFDKDMPISIIHMMRFCRNIEKGMTDGKSFCIPNETHENILREIEGEMLSLRVQYEQECSGSKKFHPMFGIGA